MLLKCFGGSSGPPRGVLGQHQPQAHHCRGIEPELQTGDALPLHVPGLPAEVVAGHWQGAALIGVLVAGTLAVASSNMWGWYSGVAVVAVVTGLIAAVVATAITAFFHFRRRLLP